VTARPDLRGVSVLHIQHEHSLFDETELARVVVQARGSRIPVVVTEHTVQTQARRWEQEATALVSLTQRGAEVLKARWPKQTVHYLPHGCHTWFPPRKRTRGRVIGAFGFLEAHKGFWKLLDALRKLHEAGDDAELLVFSHAKNAANGVAWDAAAAGLPVRRVDDFLPGEEIARRLAAEADILVFWYDESAHASASGAVRIGLATGVPVLTSATRWFEELRECTYQPPDLEAGIRRLLEDSKLRDGITAAAHDYCHAHSWQRSAERHRALWNSLR